MSFKKIVPCLTIGGGSSREEFRQFGMQATPGERCFMKCRADELVLLDITASAEGRDTIADVVRR